MHENILESIKIHQKVLDDFAKRSIPSLIAAAELITECFRGGHSLYLCGNGGSAADCQHIAGEFIGRFRRERKALSAIALSTNTSILTCIGNDYEFKDIFKRQVEASVRRGDVLWFFSTSGTSENIVVAAHSAKEYGAKVIAFTGKAASTLEAIADVCVCAGCDITSTSQEIHQLAYHIICDIVEEAVCRV